MTRDHRRKQQIRAHAARTDRSYADAATALGSAAPPPASASELRDAITAALRAAGWPVEVEYVPQAGGLVLWAGPAKVELRRGGEPRRLLVNDLDPDDPEDFDLTAPLGVTLSAPPFVDYSERLGRIIGIDGVVLGPRSPGQLVVEIDRQVARARQQDLADTPVDVNCSICGDAFSVNDLYHADDVQYGLCPSCVFDGDSPYVDPAHLALTIDQLAFRSVAAPAGWPGVQALLCCLGGPALLSLLAREWKAARVTWLPGENWSSALATWVWLPPKEQRPPALAELGCGATLERVCSAVEDAHPELRDVFRARELEDLRVARMEDGDDPAGADDDPFRVAQAVFDRFWPAAIAFAVGLLTQQAERPAHRDPWHILESFELAEWIEVLDPALDDFQVECVLRYGVPIIRDALAPRLSDEYSADFPA
jgi:hypothetical protein